MALGLWEWVTLGTLIMFFGGWGVKKLILTAKEVRKELKTLTEDDESKYNNTKTTN
jgi:hypothetical protein